MTTISKPARTAAYVIHILGSALIVLSKGSLASEAMKFHSLEWIWGTCPMVRPLFPLFHLHSSCFVIYLANFRRLHKITTHFNEVASTARGISNQYFKKVKAMEVQMAAVLELFRNPLPLGDVDGDENLGNVEDDAPAPGGSGSTA